MISQYVFLVSEKDCDQSQIHHVFKKYRISNPIVEVDRSRLSMEILERLKSGSKPPEFIMVTLQPGEGKLMGVLQTLARNPLFMNIPTIALVENPEEGRKIQEAGLARTYAMSRPVGYFKLLEALQKLELNWTVFNKAAET